MPDWDLVCGATGDEDLDDSGWSPAERRGFNDKRWDLLPEGMGKLGMGFFDEQEGQLTSEEMDEHIQHVLNDRPGKKDIRVLWENDLAHIHVTAQGKRIPLYKMPIGHLMNTIRYISDQLASKIEEHSEVTGPESMLDAIMVGTSGRQKAIKSVKRYISDSYMLLGRYLMEAMRRGHAYDAQEMAKKYFDVINKLAGTGVDNQPIKAIVIKETIKKETTDG